MHDAVDESSTQSRLQTELSLLNSMYPAQCEYDTASCDFSFRHDKDSNIVLRIPSTYPQEHRPELISARVGGIDLRGDMRQKLANLNLEEDTESLDVIIATFIETVEESVSQSNNVPNTSTNINENASDSGKLTIIIWLHHLLATSKRKAAVTPSNHLNGITKPGYPGVMIFSGSSTAVREHVTNLKGMKWQAFQVRYEEAVEWDLTAKGEVIEAEKLAEVVDAITDPKRKEVFLEIMKIK